MSFKLKHNKNVREICLEGNVRLAEILEEDDQQRILEGSLVAVTNTGEILELESKLNQDEEIELRPPQYDRDLKWIGFPVNHAGEVVGIVELLKIRTYESSHGDMLYNLSLDEIRRKVRLDDKFRERNNKIIS